MKTQHSGDSHQATKRYSGVYQQLGRPLLDADHNELNEVLKGRQDAALDSVVGSGVPAIGGAAVESLDASGLPRLRPGVLFADGVRAELVQPSGAPASPVVFSYAEQADYPAAADPAFQPPPTSLPPAAWVLYADVWERTVTFLEDPNLLDPALHGVDTCTRTQTMAQVKWCLAGDFDEPTRGGVVRPPARGDAALGVKVRSSLAKDDPCDPCAELIEVDAESGNYLFRVEVHRVRRAGPAGEPVEIELKWSSENGANHHVVGHEPQGFASNDWVYEIFQVDTEKHLGVHWATADEPAAGELSRGYPSPAPAAGSPAGNVLVRRWDGACTLLKVGAQWRLASPSSPPAAPAVDRGTPLLEGAALAHGQVEITGGQTLRLQLERLEVTLALNGREVVRGDYWLAKVRTAQHGAGGVVLEPSEPIGITHHYLKLATVDAGGILEPPTDADRRRLSFPPLTDLDAHDVDYESQCAAPGELFEGVETVRDALDALCDLQAKHVAFDNTCAPQSRILGTADNVQEALEQLCRLEATQIDYRPECPDLLGTATVHEALEKLCRRTTTGLTIPQPQVEVLPTRRQTPTGQTKPWHDELWVHWDPAPDEFLQLDPRYWLYRYRPAHKKRRHGGGRARPIGRRFVHPDHIGDGPGHPSEWPLSEPASKPQKLDFEPWTWFKLSGGPPNASIENAFPMPIKNRLEVTGIHRMRMLALKLRIVIDDPGKPGSLLFGPFSETVVLFPFRGVGRQHGGNPERVFTHLGILLGTEAAPQLRRR